MSDPTTVQNTHPRPGAVAARARVRPARWLVGTVGRLVALVLGLVAVFYLGLAAVYAIPDRPVVEHLAVDVEHHVFGPDYLEDGVGGLTDRYTECIAATSGVVPPDHPMNPFEKAVLVPRMEHCAAGADITSLAHGGSTTRWGNYVRYWNGYAVITRPAMAAWGIAGTRLLSGLFLVAGLVAVWSAVAARAGRLAASGLLLPLVLASNVLQSPMAFTHPIAIGAAVAGLVLPLVRSHTVRGAVLAAATAGAVFNYVDLLTVSGTAWSFAALGAGLAAWHRRRPAGTVAARVLAGAVGWGAGYALTWVLRWVIGALLLGFGHVYRDIVEVGRFRLGGEYGEVQLTFGAATAKNFRYWTEHTATADLTMTLVGVACLVALVVAVRRHGTRGLTTALALALPALLVPLWYEVMRNHSQIHTFFVYRSLPAGFGILLLACLVAARRGPDRPPAPDAAPALLRPLTIVEATRDPYTPRWPRRAPTSTTSGDHPGHRSTRGLAPAPDPTDPSSRSTS